MDRGRVKHGSNQGCNDPGMVADVDSGDWKACES